MPNPVFCRFQGRGEIIRIILTVGANVSDDLIQKRVLNCGETVVLTEPKHNPPKIKRIACDSKFGLVVVVSRWMMSHLFVGEVNDEAREISGLAESAIRGDFDAKCQR